MADSNKKNNFFCYCYQRYLSRIVKIKNKKVKDNMLFKRIKGCILLAYELLVNFVQLLYGAWHASRLGQPIISIFGSARLLSTDLYFRKAHQLAEMFVKADISVLTGGGGGIMEGASCGAILTKPTRAMSIGISVTDLKEGKNPCVHEYLVLRYFFARKWLLTRYSTGFVFFPGGFGTLDELAEVLTLIQTNKLKKVPIVLIGKEYWGPFMKWLMQEALVHGTVDQNDLMLFTLTDDLNEAFCLVRDQCQLVFPSASLKN